MALDYISSALLLGQALCIFFFLRLHLLLGQKLVLGCGSNVVDQIFKVQAVPKPGEKGFFRRYIYTFFIIICLSINTVARILLFSLVLVGIIPPFANCGCQKSESFPDYSWGLDRST